MAEFSAPNLASAAQHAGLEFPPYVLDQVVAAIDAGKHVILTGPPGTGKTSLAYLAAEVGRQAMLCTGYLPTTATSEWTSTETIGGFQVGAHGTYFRPGLLVAAIESGRWLVIDELNRSNFDRAFGQLFTVLSGQSVVLPYKRSGVDRHVSIVPQGAPVPEETDPVRVPASWRIIATMNVLDRHLLFELSYALMRRFAFIEVTPPGRAAYERMLAGQPLMLRLLPLLDHRELGPAVFVDAAHYAARRRSDDVSDSRVLYEVFYAFLLPQLQGVPQRTAEALLFTLSSILEPPELRAARRAMSDMLSMPLGAGLFNDEKPDGDLAR
jgi:energy-coupling factor transporter ATP-binding protein EcfA2